jgi:hypothetical protein
MMSVCVRVVHFLSCLVGAPAVLKRLVCRCLPVRLFFLSILGCTPYAPLFMHLIVRQALLAAVFSVCLGRNMDSHGAVYVATDYEGSRGYLTLLIW